MNDDLIAETIINMATDRGPEKTVCPSDIARALFPVNWRSQMDAVRSAAVKLQQSGKVLITQKGEQVDVDHIKGPIRIKITNQRAV